MSTENFFPNLEAKYLELNNKIDYFPGLHGHYLELILNVFVFHNNFDTTKNLFTDDGACHAKNTDPSYIRHILASHWSSFRLALKAEDKIVRIVPTKDDLLLILTNYFLRANDEKFDLYSLEVDTTHKLQQGLHGISLLRLLTKEYGQHQNYSRKTIRNFFYLWFSDEHQKLKHMTVFNTVPKEVYEFPFRSFFEFDSFYYQINQISKFFNCDFAPTADLHRIHQQFLDINHGLNRERYCKEAWKSILTGESKDITLNILEEAWMNYQIAERIGTVDIAELQSDSYPKNTKEISNIINR